MMLTLPNPNFWPVPVFLPQFFKIRLNLLYNPNQYYIPDWIAIGFSDYGEPQNADLCVLWSDWKGEVSLEDTHTNDNESLLLKGTLHKPR